MRPSVAISTLMVLRPDRVEVAGRPEREAGDRPAVHVEEPGRPVALFEFDQTKCDSDDRTACYDVSQDGQRFYLLQSAEPTRSASVDLVMNLFAELKRIIP